MPRSTAPKQQEPQQEPQPANDPVSLIGKFADVPQPQAEEIIIGKVAESSAPAPAPKPVVTIDDDGSITIK